MSDGKLVLRVSEDGADAERLDVLAGYLRAELVQLDVDHIARLPGGEPPPGTRGSSVATVGGLLVSLGQSAEALQAIVSAVVNWLHRAQGPDRKVRLELDGDVLELSRASASEQERLIELFVTRHGAGAAS
jgi:hypothetical protein